MKLRLTLSRAHKISERISTKMAEARMAACHRGVTQNMSAMPTIEQIQNLRTKASAAEAAAVTFATLAKVQANIREVIADANVKFGISKLLAVVEANKKVISLYDDKALSQLSAAESVHVDSLPEYVWPANDKFGFTALSVTAVSRDVLAKTEQDKKALARENFALTDKIAELNAKVIEIEIPDELAQELGL